MDDAQNIFGGNMRTQMIGKTIYAPTHEYNELTAICILCHYLLKYLFE